MAAGESINIAWKANSRINRALSEHLEPAMLQACTPGGGMSVAEHLAHMTGTVKYWGMKLTSERFGQLPDLEEKIDEQWVPELDTERIAEVQATTREVALAEVMAAPDGVRGDLPHVNAEMYLIHMLVHDAHHRGQILLALKTAGHPLPDDDAMWVPWKNG